jgi:hypothetical protein
VIEALAPLERLAGSEGEREAAEWIAARLGQAGAPAQVEEAEFDRGFAGVIASLAATAAGAGLVSLSGRFRKLTAAAGFGAAALIADDIQNGIRPYRKAVAGSATTWNVVAEAGDPKAERTLIVLAHHDAAQTGAIFDPTAQRMVGDSLPGVIERIDTSIPQWWGVLAGPLLVAAGSLRRSKPMVATGMALSSVAAAALGDIERGRVVPGANDNLSAVAVIIALAEALRERPIKGLRIVLASVGAEEVLQGGIYAFCERHLDPLDRHKTWFLNVDTVGSPELVLLEGEGPVVMEDYFDKTFRQLIARVAEREGIPLRRGMRSRNSTDAVVPSRRRVPTACLVSLNEYKALDNYHLPSDTPEKIKYPTVACAADLCEAVARELAEA